MDETFCCKCDQHIANFFASKKNSTLRSEYKICLECLLHLIVLGDMYEVQLLEVWKEQNGQD
jgi:hypothetical protein